MIMDDYVQSLKKSIKTGNLDQATAVNARHLFKRLLSNETDKELLAEIIRTTGKFKMESMTDDITEFIFYDDPILKATAVKALERIGTTKAFESLEQASKTEKCDKNILDALQSLKAENSVEKTAGLAEHLKNNLGHDQAVNISGLISQTRPVETVNDLFFLLNQKETDNTIRFAVYCALEAFPKLESPVSAVQGISESSLPVRLAAMKVLDKNLSDSVCAEIKNKIESGTKKGELLAETILDARAGHIIEYLMISDTFSYMASNYLTRTAPVQTLDTYIEILEKRNLKATAKKYQDIRRERAARDKDRVIVISPFESVLNTYCKLLSTSGVPSLTFHRSQDAFEAVVSQKPWAIICDLFLKDMTGMDFAGEIRGLYSKEDMPIIISILGKNLPMLRKELDRTGVNALWEFPPKPNQIKSQFKSWVKSRIK